MTYYVALDVGLRMVSLCIVDEAGGVKLEKSLPSEIDVPLWFLSQGEGK